ncbi:protein NYNRIN-like [Eleutherodactylus coqui]|uniref:protein NYNRIN-like n=1 Tax=Eleutherodactylus coqui TaxID=57060 RepID=UPI0034622C8B
MPLPTSHAQLRTFLGLVSYCRPWIRSASMTMQPLYDCLSSKPFALSPEAESAFHQLKIQITSAPALGLPDYDKPFQMFVTEMAGHATAVLTQEHGDKKRPVAYYSAHLDAVARGSPSCVRAVLAVQALLEKASEVVLDYPLVVLTPHDVHGILTQVSRRHLSLARQVKMELAVHSSSNVSFQRCTTLNPATLLPLGDTDSKGGVSTGDQLFVNSLGEEEAFDTEHQHDCAALMEQETAGFAHVTDKPLLNPHLEMFVDGSRYQNEMGRFVTGFAVVSMNEVLIGRAMPPHMSAQEAELCALTEACKLARGVTANIYTDSRYAFGVAHDYGPIWRARSFLTAQGRPIKNGEAVSNLMSAIMLPKQVAIIKVKAHTRGDSLESRGNEKADGAAKAAALLDWRAPVCRVQTRSCPAEEDPDPPAEDQTLSVPPQKEVDLLPSGQEQERWASAGAVKGNEGWMMGFRMCLPAAAYPSMALLAHGKVHASRNAMVALVEKMWYAPGFDRMAKAYVKACEICALHNPGQVVKTPRKCTPRPLYPFQRLQIDYIQLPRSGRYEYVLVCIDLFSAWPEAYPVPKATAQATAKKLVSELVCRFGVPETIESDRGTHFTGEVMKEVMSALGVEQAFHTPYHPQSSGKVERLNGTLKLKIQKAMVETGKPWPECLPLALYSVRTTPNRKTGLSPYEILFGSVPRLGLYHPQALSLGHDKVTSFVQDLCQKLKITHDLVFSSIPDPDSLEGSHSLNPGDWVVVKRHVRKTLEPRFDGPYQVLLTTPTSVKLEGKPTWIHASHCKKVPTPQHHEGGGE